LLPVAAVAPAKVEADFRANWRDWSPAVLHRELALMKKHVFYVVWPSDQRLYKTESLLVVETLHNSGHFWFSFI